MTVDLDRQASEGTTDFGRRTATVTTTEVGFPLDFFRSSNRFLRFPSDLQNCCMEIVSVFFYLLKFLFQLLGVQNVSRVCIFCQGNLCFGECQFSFLVHEYAFLLPTAIILRIGMVFPPFC